MKREYNNNNNNKTDVPLLSLSLCVSFNAGFLKRNRGIIHAFFEKREREREREKIRNVVRLFVVEMCGCEIF